MKTHLHAYSVRFTFCHCDLLQTYETVSYTHLDVYKRQKQSQQEVQLMVIKKAEAAADT